VTELFSGYGYEVQIVQHMDDIDAEMCATMDWAYRRIRYIQNEAREGRPIFKPKWPLIILKTPKGWTGIKTLEGKQIEGSWRSHQIPADPHSGPAAFRYVNIEIEALCRLFV
jgi:xylulose-5-phosphate/fructose-6-phosphate phosphoketolase